ncbi:MAG: kelch repeat-containing protein, partial [Thermoplasmatota archaeon]
YVYGGGYTTGQGPNTRYWTLDDFWKVDLDTYSWTLIYEDAFPGERQGIELLYNPDTDLLYFYGGYSYLDPADAYTRQIYADFYSFDPDTSQFKMINPPATNPGGRFGSSLVYDYDDDVMYLFGGEHLPSGSPTSKLENVLWRYDFTANKWTEIDATYKPSDRDYGKMVYDPLTKELYLLGGGENDDLVRFRILEGRWYTDWYPVPNPGTLSGHALFFDTAKRDIWLFGGGAKSGIWRMGIPARLAIQNVEFTNAEDGNTLAYAMLKTYNFEVVTKTVTGPGDLDEMKFDLTHSNGKFTLIYKRSEDYPGGEPWTELDNGDYAELTADPTVTVDGELLTFDIPLKFHWNWTHKSSQIERTVDVRCTGIGVDEDALKTTFFLSVRNQLELKGRIDMEGEFQGSIKNESWIRSDEKLTIHGPVVSYVGTDIHPPVGTYEVRLWDENDDYYVSSAPAGEGINITLNSPNSTKTGYKYILNITGVPENTDTTEIELMLNVDGNSPEAPAILTLHADKADDSRTDFDNDLDIIATWQAAFETGSGVKVYYWAFSDLGGTRLGTELNITTKADIHLPTNGSHTVYIWAEDKVGNIGPAANATIVVDDEPIIFDLLSPDPEITIPYDNIDIVLNITDYGGSLINRFSVQYRYTSGGLNDEVNWLGSEAWQYYQTIWDLEDSSNFLVEMELKDLSQGADNFFQFRAVDGAGSQYESEVFNFEVDFDLAYPKVTIVGPANYAEFSDAEDIVLSWNVDFFEPKDVEYYLYMSTIKDLVVNHQELGKWRNEPIIGTEYQPTGLTFGTYYWTIVPIAKGEYQGECLNGYFQFNLTNEESYAFDVNPDEDIMRFQQGTVGIPINFDITNKGNFDAYIKPSLLTEGLVNITWETLPDSGYFVRVGSSYTAIAMMTIPSNATIGNHTLVFEFRSDMGLVRTREITLQITKRQEVAPPEEDSVDPSLFIVIGIILVIVILAVIGALYFFVFKKKGKKDEITLEHELDELEKEYGISSGVAVAPLPKGGATKALPSAKTPRPPVEGEEELDEFQDVEEEPQLVAPGSEDDWMNIVAAETVALERQSAVEEDKMVQSDGQPKDISDILGEMIGEE